MKERRGEQSALQLDAYGSCERWPSFPYLHVARETEQQPALRMEEEKALQQFHRLPELDEDALVIVYQREAGRLM